VLRLVGFLLTFVLGVGGFVAVDYTMAKRWASAEDSEGLTFGEYIGGLSGRLAGASASNSSGLPTALADMMPTAPEGWTVRPTVPEDVDIFMPKKRTEGTPEARDYVEAMGKVRAGSGVEAVVLTYEKGERRVVIKAVRYPDLIFTSFMAMQQRMELQMAQPKFLSRDFMTVRGLDITEDFLPDGMRARYFMADVGAQIHIRVLASKRMKDEDLVPFFQTLHVKAMNASVIDKQDGLGDVPVIVLASVLDEATREAYEADRATREEADAKRRDEERLAAEAEAQAATDAEAKEKGGALESEGSLTMQGDKGANGKPGDCEERAGTKFCGVGGDGSAADGE
jgi:hypothetical protein